MTAYSFEMGMTPIGPTSLSIPLRPAKRWKWGQKYGQVVGQTIP